MAYERSSAHGDPSTSLRAVFVASPDLLATWSARMAPGAGILTFTDADLPHALQIIAERRPPLVILEQMLAASSRGSAFMGCIQGNPDFAGVDIQVLSAERIAAAAAPGALLAAALAVGTHGPTLERSAVRRAARIKARDELTALIDGNPVTLVDISVLGAQVVSPSALRPNQRVRVQFVENEAAIRATAGIAWSSFEKPSLRVAPYFRVGMEFSTVDPDLKALYERLCWHVLPDECSAER